MTSFDQREKAFEAKFAHDADRKFKILSRRNKMLAEWAGGKLGLSGAALADYGHAVVKTEIASAGDQAVFAKLTADFAAKGVAIANDDVRRQMDVLLAKAIADTESGQA